MAKLSHSISNGNNEEENKNIQTGSLSIKKNVTNSENGTPKNGDSAQVEEIKSALTDETVSSPEAIADWIHATIGSGVFEILKKNSWLQLPFASPDEISGKEWLLRALKTIFAQEQFAELGNEILKNQQNQTQSIQKSADSETEQKIAKMQQNFEMLQQQLENRETEKFKIEKELQNALPLSKFISLFFKDDDIDTPSRKQLRNMLNETVEHPQKQTAEFVILFGKGWAFIQNALSELVEDEKENMEKVHKATIDFLESITETRIPERRELLDLTAKIINENFKEYEFISPEQTLQIDPSIHNAQGKGSSPIKEGVSFAVIRKASRQAVKYAEIKV
jgi:hypothetical protein